MLWSINYYDFPVGALWAWGVSIIFLIILTLLIVVSEAYILQQLHYGPFQASLGSSLMMNVVSSISGYLVASIGNEMNLSLYHEHIGNIAGWFLFLGTNRYPGILITFLFLVFSLIISVLSEGFVLVRLGRDHSTKTIWRMTVIANGVSYALMFILYIIVFIFLSVSS